MALVVQEFKLPRLYGHLSNERRVSQRSNRWLCEIETSAIAGSPKLFRFNVKASARGLVTKPFPCADESALEQSLRDLAAYSAGSGDRFHFEWVWDGEQLWVVQRDSEAQNKGEMPSTSTVPVLFEVSEPNLTVFIDATKTTKPWKKAASLKIFSDAGLPRAILFVLENEPSLSALAKGQTPPHLKIDLRSLLQSPIVIRTDFLTTGDKPALLSPRSETLTSAELALDWLKENAAEIVARGIRPNQFAFFAHRYITARSGAFGLSRPDHPRVRVDSTWGFPDGLLCFPHDSFEINLADKDKILKHVRCKPFYLTSTQTGVWSRQKCFAPWDWRPSLTDDELKSIARHTKRVCEHLNRPVEVMFFVGVDAKTGYPSILPWIHLLDLPEKQPKEAGDFYYAGKPFTVSNEVDLTRLRAAIDRKREVSKSYIRLQPSPELLRSKEFVLQVASVANDLRMPVQLEGSILSHIYYMLTKQNVRVRCADPFSPTQRRFFGKLVRDLIPVTIESRGERTRTFTVPKEELAKLLKVKALEEAFELFWETDAAKSFEEMADILEVLQSACHAYGRDFEALSALAEKKRKLRGGFEKGVVLVETSFVPLIGDEDPELSLFDAGKAALIGSTVASKASGIGLSRRPRSKGREAMVPLIPPTAEDTGKPFVISLPDVDYQLEVRYRTKEVVISVRPKPPPPPPPNQLELKLDS
jgi:predicted house-cleaning noncanonical NTP pyrophosphatase (MazG superfamily)